MLARLILALLALAFATPATAAACHAPVAERHATAAHHGSAPARPHDDGVAVHACAGCVPPSNWIAPRIAAPAPVVAPPPSHRVAAIATGRGAPPALPPPRGA